MGAKTQTLEYRVEIPELSPILTAISKKLKETATLVEDLANAIELKEKWSPKGVTPQPKPDSDPEVRQALKDIEQLLQDIKKQGPQIINIPRTFPDTPQWPDLQKWAPPMPIYCDSVQVPHPTAEGPKCEVEGSVVNQKDTVLHQPADLADFLQKSGLQITSTGEVKHGNKK